MITGKNILITGGAGFIGSALIGHLVDENKITVLDSFVRNALMSKPYSNHDNLTVVKGDIRDVNLVREVIKGKEIVVHCAAIAGIDSVARKPADTMLINMVGTSNLLEAAKSVDRLERFVDFSTSEVFGTTAFNSEESDSSNIGAVGQARWTYAVSKLAGEHLTFSYCRQYGMPTVSVRPFNIYGPGQVGEGAMHVFIRKALANENLYVFGEGTQIRSWCYIDDMIDGVLRAMASPSAVGESFNIGNARAVITILGLAQTVCRVLGSKSKIGFRNGLPSDIELRIPSVQKARDVIGFKAKVDLEEGIQRTGQWYLEHQGELPRLPKVFD